MNCCVAVALLLLICFAKASRGWEYPPNGNGRELVIAVPKKNSFPRLLKVEVVAGKDPNVSGYYHDVFHAVMKSLSIPYKFKSFPISHGYETYDNIIHQVSSQEEYDGAMGDFTVTAERSKYVDFTVPFAGGGVGCIVPMKPDHRRHVVWELLDPLPTTAIFPFYIFTALMFWLLVKRIVRISPDFQGQHVGMICYLPFFPGQGIEGGLLCLILVMWALVTNLLWSVYTARLSSILTVERLEPTVTTVHQLVNRTGSIGYQEASFLPDYLKKLGFQRTQMKKFLDRRDILKALSNNTIGGYCDVMPHIMYILSQGCAKFALVSPVYYTVGFAIAFARGYGRVDDVSRAILEMINNGTILDLEETMFSNLESEAWNSGNCNNSNGNSSGDWSGSFCVLLAIPGCVTVAALIVSWLYDVDARAALLQTISLRKLSSFYSYFRHQPHSQLELQNVS